MLYRRIRRRLIALGLVALLAMAIAPVTGFAQSGGYAVEWWSADSGGGASAGGVFTLGGTLGQPDAGAMSGGGFGLSGGFWNGRVAGQASPQEVFLPVVLRDQ